MSDSIQFFLAHLHCFFFSGLNLYNLEIFFVIYSLLLQVFNRCLLSIGHYSFGAHNIGQSPSFPKSSILVKERRQVEEKTEDGSAAEKTAKSIKSQVTPALF